jgi:hypothetical protein
MNKTKEAYHEGFFNYYPCEGITEDIVRIHLDERGLRYVRTDFFSSYNQGYEFYVRKDNKKGSLIIDFDNSGYGNRENLHLHHIGIFFIQFEKSEIGDLEQSIVSTIKKLQKFAKIRK